MSACGNAKSFNACLYDAQGMLQCENNKGAKDPFATNEFVVENFTQASTVDTVKQKIDEVRNKLVSDMDMSKMFKFEN